MRGRTPRTEARDMTITLTSASTSSSALTPEPVPFHRVAHARGARRLWFRPLVALVVSALAYVLFGLLLVLATALVAGVAPQGAVLEPSASWADPLNPMDQVLGLGSLALMIPAVLIGTRVAYGRAGLASSVLGRLRWGLLARAAVIVVPIHVLVNIGLSLLIERDALVMPRITGGVLAAWLLALLLAPLQSAGEEYAFRSLPQQALGTWLRHPAWGILLPVPLFVLGHGYDPLGQVGIGIFAVAMGLLAWKTGGIELPILLHAANNTTLFAIAPMIPGFTEQGEVTVLGFLVSTVPLLLLTVGLWRWFDRREGLAPGEPCRGAATVRCARPVPAAAPTTLES